MAPNFNVGCFGNPWSAVFFSTQVSQHNDSHQQSHILNNIEIGGKGGGGGKQFLSCFCEVGTICSSQMGGTGLGGVATNFSVVLVRLEAFVLAM